MTPERVAEIKGRWCGLPVSANNSMALGDILDLLDAYETAKQHIHTEHGKLEEEKLRRADAMKRYVETLERAEQAEQRVKELESYVGRIHIVGETVQTKVLTRKLQQAEADNAALADNYHKLYMTATGLSSALFDYLNGIDTKDEATKTLARRQKEIDAAHAITLQPHPGDRLRGRMAWLEKVREAAHALVHTKHYGDEVELGLQNRLAEALAEEPKEG